ncbi:bifunctional Leucyl-tRNA synthetase [Babesia duncani]|uniref:leucine--tRNA ligase n=1 Tax=Babesia duncani TaxID=323732 RepID=A0AAD9PKV3_9APIC|nr:bifunctional Leucyl-tRNA synthetase [Babesia duncani]
MKITKLKMSKRAQLLENEALVRALWEEGHVYEAHVPNLTQAPKYFCTFPYPYMNGRLHIGHAFSASKSEFQARFQRSLGKNVLWPFGLHCTGMPITACADKIKLELQNAALLEKSNECLDNNNATNEPQSEESQVSEDVTRHSGKKTKLASKSNAKMTQIEIMKHMGIDSDDIPKFANPQHWLDYFSPLAIKDMQNLGFAIDWRRTFITTDRNPYYNAFVKWQFNRLKKLDKLHYGCRPSILSRLVMQPCADHDRAEGEGAVAQEYTLIKLRMLDGQINISERLQGCYKDYQDILQGYQCFLVAATLRPETMYGQTNVFMLPQGEYVAVLGYATPKFTFNDVGVCEATFEIEQAVKSCDCIYITSKKSAINMAYQGIVMLNKAQGNELPSVHEICSFTGMDLFGSTVWAPNSVNPKVHILPMTTISMEKGTGIVTCVPSDSPDDYCTLMEMKKKPDYFCKTYKLDPRMFSLDAVPVLEIPGIGTCAAATLCTEQKIASNKDRTKLDALKELLYKRGFYEGTMVAGPYKGLKVSSVKDKIREELVEQGDALIYYEPSKRVVSRSGDVCIVAMCNQWYTKFGDKDWKRKVMEHVSNPDRFTCYNESTRNQILHVVEWLENWACSRSYGLGTRLPWEDPERNRNSIIESLSDSTIYMAYYTICHYLQGDVFGTKPGRMGASPQDFTDEVFDYIFCITDNLPDSVISPKLLQEAKSEFSYWYPVDLRCSGKDLIFNHLTMSLFIHAAIWHDSLQAERMPKSFVCVGHVLVDAEKMSKSKGNFLTVQDAISRYTADGTRVAIADAGDGLDDANFAQDVAEAAVLKLHAILVASQADVSLPPFTGEMDSVAKYAKDVFVNEIKVLAHQAKCAYESFLYRDALKYCFYDYINIRKTYVQMAQSQLDHQALGLYYNTFCKIASPIVPHICEYIWSRVLGHGSMQCVATTWPFFEDIDWTLHHQAKMLYKNLEEFKRARERMQSLGKRKGAPPSPCNHGIIYIAKSYPPLQNKVMQLLNKLQETQGIVLSNIPDKQLLALVSNSEEIKQAPGVEKKQMLAFAAHQIKQLEIIGPEALMVQLPYSELDLYVMLKPWLQQSLGLTSLEVLDAIEPHPSDTTSMHATAMPLRPSIFYH